MGATSSIILELEVAIQGGSREHRLDTLRRVTDLFLVDPNRFSDVQIEVFDEVLVHLIKSVEAKALAELSGRLAPVANAPLEVIQHLARNDNIDVAHPVLTASKRLATDDLVEIAKTKSQAHLLAISGRENLTEPVTDVLIDRGDHAVINKVVANIGAAFSTAGFAALAKRAETDAGLLERLGRRLDIPVNLFRELLRRATDTVKKRLLLSAPPELRAEVRRALAKVSAEIERDSSRDTRREDAQRLVILMNQANELNIRAILDFARADKFEEILAGLALLCSVPFELVYRLALANRVDALLIPFRAAELEWTTVFAVLKMRSFCRAMSDHDIEQVREEYAKLTNQTARRVLRFWQVRETTSSHPDAHLQPAAR